MVQRLMRDLGGWIVSVEGGWIDECTSVSARDSVSSIVASWPYGGDYNSTKLADVVRQVLQQLTDIAGKTSSHCRLECGMRSIHAIHLDKGLLMRRRLTTDLEHEASAEALSVDRS